jgi:dipeptidyl-peptidase 4
MTLKPITLALFLCLPGTAFSTDVRSGMSQASELGKAAPRLIVRQDLRPHWSSDGSHLAYQINTGRDRHEFLKVNLESGAKTPAFDHQKLADALAATGQKASADRLPLDPLDISSDGSVRFRAFGKSWKFDPAADALTPDDLPPPRSDLLSPEEARRGTRRNGPPSALFIENATDAELDLFWVDGSGERRPYGKIPPGETLHRTTYAGHVWLMVNDQGEPLAAVETPDTPSSVRVEGRVAPPPRRRDSGDASPDGKWRAFIRDHNIHIQPTEGGEAIPLSSDGSADHAFTGPLSWSPDSSRLTGFRVRRVEERQIHIVQSSPPDQLQPLLKTLGYNKPGDPIRQPLPHLFEIENRREIPIDPQLFENPWSISRVAWSADSSEFHFLYNQRGHQVMRIIGVRADSGSTRVIHEETSDTFIDYSQKTYLHHLPARGEMIWASEREGYNHLYLIDAPSGSIRHPITTGPWNVREVMEVDEENRSLLIKYVGARGQDPYHLHFARVHIDTGEFTPLTSSDGNHGIRFSPDKKFILASWSRVDQPPVHELRHAASGRLLAELERADDSALRETGWSRPERFVAKGRDGETDIHGIIIRPTHFDPAKSYPVVENIYAGPHDHFVPKSYSPWSGLQAMAELGFILVKIDGMGTNWRSKAFHDVAWKNLADSGFPDRIPWIRAAAKSRPWMDLTRVGLYGGSAGGQSTLSGLLHHGGFYHVGVADCGCHDNRMDKVWWNEAWMGWPVDESYERNSNVTHAAKLSGKLLLIVGELDTNVDPASTAQVVHALQQADKDFEFLPIMNAGHGAAGTPYGARRQAEFLVRHLIAPPR